MAQRSLSTKTTKMKRDQLEYIRSIISSELDREDVELVDVDLKGNAGNQILRIYVDTPDGISLDRCSELSKTISDILDIKDPIQGSYILEVSSPGLDRPLKTIRDFQRQIGKKVRIIFREEEKSKTIEGIIKNVDDTQCVHIGGNGTEFLLAIDRIIKAKILLKW